MRIYFQLFLLVGDWGVFTMVRPERAILAFVVDLRKIFMNNVLSTTLSPISMHIQGNESICSIQHYKSYLPLGARALHTSHQAYSPLFAFISIIIIRSIRLISILIISSIIHLVSSASWPFLLAGAPCASRSGWYRGSNQSTRVAQEAFKLLIIICFAM